MPSFKEFAEHFLLLHHHFDPKLRPAKYGDFEQKKRPAEYWDFEPKFPKSET